MPFVNTLGVVFFGIVLKGNRVSKYHEVFKGGPFLKCVNLENIGVQYHLFRQLSLFLGVFS